MGNSGFVMFNGVVVLDKDRLVKPYSGTHDHFEVRVDGKYVDPLPLIDWTLPVEGASLNIIMIIIKKIIGLFK
jgi:murein DD-endopeptidase MepM/ murein hydrolase activator NlpD